MQYDRVFGSWIPGDSPPRNSHTNYAPRSHGFQKSNLKNLGFGKKPAKASVYFIHDSNENSYRYNFKDIKHGTGNGLIGIRELDIYKVGGGLPLIEDFKGRFTPFSDIKKKELKWYEQEFDLSPPF